jgi:hypothetical protein
VTALTRTVLVAVVALAVLAVSAPTVLRHVPDPRDALGSVGSGGGGAGGQSAAQISSGEFAGIRAGSSAAQLRALVGEPASKSSAEVEGVRLECWYYGVVGATGAYQFCFANGRLSTKLRYDRGRT